MNFHLISYLAGEIALGRMGVIAMVTLWCLAVGCAFLPLRHRLPPRYIVPGFVAAALLALANPSMLADFEIILVTTSIVMGSATLLVSTHPRISLRRGLTFIAIAIGGLTIPAFLPHTADRFHWVTVLALLCLPVGLLLLLDTILKLRAWYSGAFSAAMFAAAWIVWVFRAYLYGS